MLETNSQLKHLLRKEDTAERCGLILRDGQIVEAENVHLDPEKGYEVPVEFIAQHEEYMVATWHTHPNDTANLSQEDHKGFRHWPSLRHYIIGVDEVRCFEVADDFVIEVSV